MGSPSSASSNGASDLRELVAWGLVAIAVALQLACVASVLVAPGAFAKLHFTAPASTLAPGAVAAALIVAGTPSGVAIKAVLIAVVLGVTNPVLAHATARAARARENPGAS